MADTPKGVTAVLIDPGARVVASASDFDRSRPTGFTILEAQRRRARLAVANDYVLACCNPHLARAIGAGYPGIEGIVNHLVNHQSYVLHFIEHGHETEHSN